MKILFLIRSLEAGGAERQLVTLANGLAAKGHDISIATFYPDGRLQKDLKDVKTISLDKNGRWDILSFLSRLAKLVLDMKPDILHGVMGTANNLSALVKLFSPNTIIVFGIRSSDMDLSQFDWVSRMDYQIQRFMARFADLLICNSRHGLAYSEQQGLNPKQSVVIPNGIDILRFQPNTELRQRKRSKWGLKENEIAIGLVGRLDPMKDHPTFLRATAVLMKRHSNLRFFCIGGGASPYADKVKRLSEELHLNTLSWTGEERDMPEVFNALDLLCLTSTSESFPNVIAEAMACNLPCIGTDVGDVAWVIDSPQRIVPKSNPEKLVEAIEKILPSLHQRNNIPESSLRTRIQEHFSMSQLIEQTERILSDFIYK